VCGARARGRDDGEVRTWHREAPRDPREPTTLVGKALLGKALVLRVQVTPPRARWASASRRATLQRPPATPARHAPAGPPRTTCPPPTRPLHLAREERGVNLLVQISLVHRAVNWNRLKAFNTLRGGPLCPHRAMSAQGPDPTPAPDRPPARPSPGGKGRWGRGRPRPRPRAAHGPGMCLSRRGRSCG
jgi:hypothetical protein